MFYEEVPEVLFIYLFSYLVFVLFFLIEMNERNDSVMARRQQGTTSLHVAKFDLCNCGSGSSMIEKTRDMRVQCLFFIFFGKFSHITL